MEKTMPQRLIAELVGTFTLVFIAIGAITASSIAGPGGGLLAIAVAEGLAIATMVSALMHVSGAHFNPAVTIGVWIAQKIKSVEALAYIGAQLVGATLGAVVLRVAFPKTLLIDTSGGVGGIPQVATSVISNGQAVLIEAILTMFLVWVVFATAIDPEGSSRKIAGLAIGFVVLMDVLMAGPFTGAGLNPARVFGPMLVFGKWKGWWVYWVGPIAGGIVAAALYDGVIMRRRPAVETPDEVQIHGTGAHGEGAHGEGAHGEGAHGDGDHVVE